jgi:hypothetical protein
VWWDHFQFKVAVQGYSVLRWESATEVALQVSGLEGLAAALYLPQTAIRLALDKLLFLCHGRQ